MSSIQSVLAALTNVAPEAQVFADEASRALASSDLFFWPDGTLVDLVVRPADPADAARVVAALRAHDARIVPRGAGLSYTAGVVPTAEPAASGPLVAIDTTRLDAIEIHAEDRFAIVGAGCTWERLAQALQPHGLRVTQPNPISGSHSTVGGLASQGVPGGTAGIIGLTVVLADGLVVRTGSGAHEGDDGKPIARFSRFTGPDLTGLFLGDCGAFGLKTEVVVQLAPVPAAAFGSFAFDDADTMLETMGRLLAGGLATRVFSMDQARTQAATSVSAGEAAGIVGAVARSAGSVGQAIRDVAHLATARRALARADWVLHVICEAASESIAEAQLALARAACAERGREIDAVVPRTLRARPYSVRGFLGPDGERWVPVHGIFPLSRARAGMRALQACIASHASDLEACGVRSSWMISSAGNYITIEPMFHWPDALDAIHMQYLSERNRARFGGAARNDRARELMPRLRAALSAIMDEHHAVHAQVGRYYRYLDSVAEGTGTLVRNLKRALDGQRRMNAGSLGL